MLDRTDEGHEAHEILKWINQSSSISPPPLVLFFLNGSAFNLSFWDFVQPMGFGDCHCQMTIGRRLSNEPMNKRQVVEAEMEEYR
ncbi:hypothetical protein AAZX31_12G050800 [Glycine max]|uniref:Uncharacterized protein n=2 Tax=Glycine subgen. Soja TaxID=1462606 RepID=A0A0R0HF16_SOYBN|nr:hypothetical protein JHK87_032804 [Glycine soja]KAG4979618.1 hypothetical protein JHK85_033576 [Glycine max]KAG4985266.1 hypothetical protein JHK86_032957 [Glycine max]KAG5118451.1 hypothetical protein JHK82_032871 [Glycine max]KAG5139436.1 hypothetical protein JHK84_033204 [Glycine max]